MDRKKRFLLNSTLPFVLQIITIISGFIIPRLVLSFYGSEVNGLLNSVSQFLSVISFLELGVGSVIQSSLYKPIAEKDEKLIDQIMTSGSSFFKKIGIVLAVYVLLLVVFYNKIVNTSFDWIYTATLILAISIGYFSQYFVGIIDRLFLNSCQKGYVQYLIQIIVAVLNTVICIFAMSKQWPIQLVKLLSSIIFLLVPLFSRIYIKKHYTINRKATYEVEPIKGKMDGIAQHIAAIVIDGTDVIVLSLFSSLSLVSVYSVYYSIVGGIKSAYHSITTGIQPLLGEMIAKNEKDKLLSFFSKIELVTHTIVVLLFTCTGILIVPFIKIYTSGINDVNYIWPMFSLILVLAHACHCIRLVYNSLILAAGHYKQTKISYYIAAIINIVISIVLVKFYGLIGVAIGTLASMLFHTIWLVIYDSKNIINWPISNFIKQVCFDVILSVLIVIATSWINLSELTYKAWIFMAIKVVLIAIAITVIMLFVFKNKLTKSIVNELFISNKKKKETNN